VKHFLSLLLLGTMLSQSVAQNLIPNGSFEEFESCPDNFRQLDRALHWTGANTGSPELFHACGFTDDFVAPYDGDGMAGLILHADYNNSVEYLQAMLMDTLQKGKSYCFSYQIRASRKTPILINKIGAHFSKKKLATPNWEPFYLRPTVFEDEIVENRDNWQKITTQFTAKGGERFFTFGNFFEQHFLKERLVQRPQMAWYSYYYVDDFQLYPFEGDCNAYGRTAEPLSQTHPEKTLSVFFEVDSFRLLPAVQTQIDDYFQTHVILKTQLIMVKGYTDNDASVTYNEALSEKRVQSVNDYLRTIGYANTRLNWFGEEQPRNKNTNAIEKSINRRVDIFIEP